MLTTRDMEQLRPAWQELIQAAKTGAFAEGRCSEILAWGLRALDGLQELADDVAEATAAKRISGEDGRRIMAFVERVVCRLRHRLNPLAGQAMLGQIGEDLRRPSGGNAT